MTQTQINTLVSRATGESLREIRRRGFDLADRLDTPYDPEPADCPANTVDWDELDGERLSIFP